jgi:hypothetical protein
MCTLQDIERGAGGNFYITVLYMYMPICISAVNAIRYWIVITFNIPLILQVRDVLFSRKNGITRDFERFFEGPRPF